MPPEVQRRTLGLAGYDVPVVELAGPADGPRLTVLAGVHGCEDAPGHAGDMVEALEPFALSGAGISEARASELAIGYGLGYVIRQEAGPDRTVGGMTSTAAAEIGIPAIIAESGQCGLVEPAAV